MTRVMRSGKVSVPALVTMGIVAGLAILVARPSSHPRTDAPAPPHTDSATFADSAQVASPNLPAPAGQTDPPVGEFYYLVDISASTKDVGEGSAFAEGISLLQPIFGSDRKSVV